MIPATTAYGKCYILYLFVTVILLSLTSLHMCVVVAAEEPLEENVVAELKQKAGEVEEVVKSVKETNKEMVTSAEKVLLLLNTAAKNIDEEKKENEPVKNTDNKWKKILDTSNSAKDKAQQAVQDAKKIQTAANNAASAMQKVGARAKIVLNDVENMRSLIGEFKNETDTTVSLWGEVSNDDVQSLLTTTNAIVEEIDKAKSEAENANKKSPQVPHLKENDQGNIQGVKDPEHKTSTIINGNVGEKGATTALPAQEGPEESPEKLKMTVEKGKTLQEQEALGQPGVTGVKAPGQKPENVQEADLRRDPATPGHAGLQEPSEIAGPTPSDPVSEVAIKILPGQGINKIFFTKSNIKQATTKVMKLMQNEMADEEKSAHNLQKNKDKKQELVESFGESGEEAIKLTKAVHLVKEKINNARQLSERVAQLADTVIKMKESKELSVMPSSFGGLVFVVNNICLTTFVTLTYVFGNTL